MLTHFVLDFNWGNLFWGLAHWPNMSLIQKTKRPKDYYIFYHVLGIFELISKLHASNGLTFNLNVISTNAKMIFHKFLNSWSQLGIVKRISNVILICWNHSFWKFVEVCWITLSLDHWNLVACLVVSWQHQPEVETGKNDHHLKWNQ